MSGPNSNPNRNSLAISETNHAQEFEQESGRATRARTRLIVEGFSNLAIIATFFAGVQAQLLSVTNSEIVGSVAIATNAAFFGGLIFSVFTAVLATLSARWFSILREDDADYLSSRWLSQDSKHKDDALLEKYLDYQIKSMEKIKERGANNCRSYQCLGSQTHPAGAQSFSPVLFDAECILQILRKERGYGPKDSDLEKAMVQNAHASDTATLVKTPQQGAEESITTKPDMPKSTRREQILSYVLLSPLIACLPSFALFTTGILLLAWDKQPLPVAIFTSATVLICIVPLCGFFIRHRHKHVIGHIYLGRPSL